MVGIEGFDSINYFRTLPRIGRVYNDPGRALHRLLLETFWVRINSLIVDAEAATKMLASSFLGVYRSSPARRTTRAGRGDTLCASARRQQARQPLSVAMSRRIECCLVQEKGALYETASECCWVPQQGPHWLDQWR